VHARARAPACQVDDASAVAVEFVREVATKLGAPLK
jgi:hypothetical protein